MTGLNTPIPYSKPMEDYVLPDEDKIVSAAREVLGLQAVPAEPGSGGAARPGRR